MPMFHRERNVVYFAMPKTGSTWVRDRMLHKGAQSFMGHHDSICDHRWSGRGAWKPFGTVRNPWDWYPSWWQHAMSTGKPEWKTFKEALRYATSGAWAEAGDRAGVFYEMGLRPQRGLYAATFTSVYDDMMTFVATDRLNEGFAEFFGLKSDEPFTNTRHQRDGSEVVWPRPAGHYADWYDDEMIGWVAQADDVLIDCFGFEPFTPSPRALYKETP
jgi:hypothetical protein